MLLAIIVVRREVPGMTRKKKHRILIEEALAARVLFNSDRTCCVCRSPGKSVQIHHVDDNPANNVIGNLAVLCLDCHEKTQVSGGFARKLDAEQIILYRDDWTRSVTLRRAASLDTGDTDDTGSNGFDVVRATTLAEIYRERRQHELLALHYNAIGNNELRDKYIDLAIAEAPTDESIFFLRGLQGRMDLVPGQICKRILKRYKQLGADSQIARFYRDLHDYPKALSAYARDIETSVREGNIFSAAFYLKEAAEMLPDLFTLALAKAKQDGALWWQVRALQELGWDDELRDLLLKNREGIEGSGDADLERLLALELGDKKRVLEIDEEEARTESLTGFEGTIGEDAGDRYENGEPVRRLNTRKKSSR
jgi:hypothetical protein